MIFISDALWMDKYCKSQIVQIFLVICLALVKLWCVLYLQKHEQQE